MHDNCGVFALASKSNVIDDLFLGTFYLQHRGQEYCGLSTCDGKSIKIRTHRGLVREKFNQDLAGLDGHMGLGHASLRDRQPVKVDSKLGEFTICFSGNIINIDDIINDLKAKGHTFSTGTVVEVLAEIISHGKDFADGIEIMANTIKGSYALAILTKEGVYATRDRRGYRPLILGKRDDGTVAVSSESCAFNNLFIKIVRDVEPGEVVLLADGEIRTVKKIKSDMVQYCAFEWIYIANAASIIDGQCVDIARMKTGAFLAKRAPAAADIICAVPNSGIGHALGFAHESKIPYDNVFVKYDYASRSYTKPTQAERDREAKVKLIPVGPKIKGKRVVLCDDSIVRGTQMKNDLVVKLNTWGVKEIHVRIACPPLMAPCRYGISTREKKELAAHGRSVEDIRKYIGVDSLYYNTIEDVAAAIGKPQKDLCTSCWTDVYK
jgi:amidophosphoribosyltransferase